MRACVEPCRADSPDSPTFAETCRTDSPDSPTFAEPCCADSPDSPTLAEPCCADSPDSPTLAKGYFWEKCDSPWQIRASNERVSPIWREWPFLTIKLKFIGNILIPVNIGELYLCTCDPMTRQKLFFFFSTIYWFHSCLLVLSHISSRLNLGTINWILPKWQASLIDYIFWSFYKIFDAFFIHCCVCLLIVNSYTTAFGGERGQNDENNYKLQITIWNSMWSNFKCVINKERLSVSFE